MFLSRKGDKDSLSELDHHFDHFEAPVATTAKKVDSQKCFFGQT